MSDEPQANAVDAPAEDHKVGRRRLINGLAFSGAIVGVGAASAAVARATETSVYRSKRLTVDVACLGELWREGARGKNSGDNDYRTPFGVEGWIYPAGTILGDGFVPREKNSIGRWFCRGYGVGDDNRQFDNAIGLGKETGHFHVQPKQVCRIQCHFVYRF